MTECSFLGVFELSL